MFDFQFIGPDSSVTVDDLLKLERSVTRLEELLPSYEDGHSVQCEQDAHEKFDGLDGADKLEVINLICEASCVVNKVKAVRVLKNRG